MHERRVKRYIGIAVQRHILHELKRLGEIGAAVGVDKVIAPMHRGRDGLIPPCGGNAIGDRQHDRIPVGDNGDPHRFFGIMPVGYIHIISQRGSGQRRTDPAHIDDVMGNIQTFGAERGIVQFLAVTLTVVERHQPRQLAICRHHMSERHRIQSAGADDNRFHFLTLVLIPG